MVAVLSVLAKETTVISFLLCCTPMFSSEKGVYCKRKELSAQREQMFFI